MNNDHQPKHRKLWSGLTSDDASAEVGILGIPYEGAASFRKGTAQAPARIRSLTPHVAPYTESGRALSGLRVRDLNDVDVSGDWIAVHDRIVKRVEELLEHPFAIVLGGDHSVTIPVFHTFSETMPGPLGYLHLDAHLDLMPTFEGRTWSHACTARRVLEAASISPEHTVFVGIRSWLDEEIAFLRDHPEIQVLTASTIAEGDMTSLVTSTLTPLRNAASVYVTVDIDVLDPAFAPGTGTPEAGGLSIRDLLRILRLAFEHLPIRALDVVEVSPPLDHSDITSFAAVKLLYEVFGWIKERNVR